MTENSQSDIERPDRWPDVFFVTYKYCDHRFEWTPRLPQGRYECTRCGKARAEPPLEKISDAGV